MANETLCGFFSWLRWCMSGVGIVMAMVGGFFAVIAVWAFVRGPRIFDEWLSLRSRRRRAARESCRARQRSVGGHVEQGWRRQYAKAVRRSSRKRARWKRRLLLPRE